MQGQGLGSSSNSFPGNFYFNGGLESEQHAGVHEALASDGHASMRWIGQSSSGHGAQNHASFSQFLADDFWLSPLGDRASGSSNQRFEEGHASEPNYNHFLQNAGMGSGNGHMISCEHGPIGASESFPGLEAGSGHLQHNLDLNAVGHDGSGIETSQDHGPYLSLDLFRSGDHIPNSGGSSSPVMIYSGIAGYVLEENINGEGLPTDGQRRLLCKRRAPDFASGHGTYGANSSSAWQAGNSEQSWVTAEDNSLNSSHSGILAAPPAPSHFYQVPNEAGQVDSFQRNTRLRRTATPLDFWALNSNDSNVQATGQSSVYSPLDGFTVASSAGPVNPAMQPIVQISANFVHAPQPSQYWNRTPMSWLGSSSTSHDQTANMREAFGLEENIRNNTRNTMIPLVNIEANLNLGNGNANIFGNIASSSRNQAGTGVYLPTSSMRFPQPSMAMRDIVDPSEAWSHGDYCPIHSGASPAVRDMEVSVRGGNPRSSQVPLRLGPRAERQAAHHSELSATLLSQAAAQRRSRLVSEVRNALGLGRRPGGLRIEDVRVLDPSYLYDMHDDEDPDFDEDMRLDVDNMSYEELLELEEEIGNVSIGLSEETILANLRRRIYQSITVGSPVEVESCCICQEDYANGEELGKLDCGHDFHFNCIKPWLVQKNSCPICKKTALAI